MIKKVLLSSLLTITLTACTAIQTPLDEDYTFGDTYKSVYTLQQTYCASTDPAQQALYRGLLKRLYGDYPSEGVCTDILEVLNSYEEDNEG
jgi:hypothetical protein|tara:strand:- start:692 stop:964 length:273 start_codon:yes stop_codon:yes gene_type:complete